MASKITEQVADSPEIETESFLKVETSHLITEDDDAVDNMFSEKQQRLLTEPLYTSWKGPGGERPFLVTANVGLFMVNQNPAIVPDVLLSLDVVMPEDWWTMKGRSYAVWELGKTPDLVVEIVSNKKGNELESKLKKYEQLRVPIYIVHDPDMQIQDEPVSIYLLNGFGYRKSETMLFPEIGLGLTLWDGEFENRNAQWLRWTDLDGNLIATGDDQRERADEEKTRADRLAAQLRAAGIEPDA